LLCRHYTALKFTQACGSLGLCSIISPHPLSLQDTGIWKMGDVGKKKRSEKKETDAIKL
jgi:hypothetical protein